MSFVDEGNKKNMGFNEWAFWVRRRVDMNPELWPSHAFLRDAYEDLETVHECVTRWKRLPHATPRHRF